MLQWKKMFRQSAQELKNPRALTVTALFIAMNIAMDAMNVRIQITQDLRIGFGFLTSSMIGMLFGPVVGMVAGAGGEILGWLVNNGNGAYFPGFTLTAILAGLVWGCCLYQKKVSWWRCLLAKGIINVALNIGLNSLWLGILRGQGYILGLMPLRIVKNLILLPIEVCMLYFVAKLVMEIYTRVYRKRA